ncbi:MULTISPECIES: xylulokinase [Bradyrhizobium]|uniref:Xylulose kinase n=2 Tax=Bradyrhizobium diazoefficiens TaxID=1355477 RepID=Q89I54_BRADU|nr:xylulokinase [Bradyrhizobium diazoefficiens]AND90945.1 xylulose kinase [Bradyrhizobium diazoefficiens USDA 110]QBP24559.1 xylulokinase [Bradyrhizobium diazoefficiens]QLD47283.1 xylulokinase [Bradyrhizobium diazoefficiens]WLA61254.1 xylulokinase [Bradyrhizobium diazoefficiens]WLB42545.1 xylulokinase [Bradyrhizobium diazoefficiens]
MYLGIDLGTSAVKTVLVDSAQRVIASESRPLATASPRPGYSEQDPAQWVEATFATLDALKATHAGALAVVEGIGLSGQMHGATLLDASARPLRPCILWNDGRSVAECRILEQRWPALRATTGNKAMPGFTAPKLLWIATHEPEVFAATKRVLLPKAYLRLVLTGEAVEDVSDASGSLWLDAARRDWSDAALAATGLSRDHMPRLVEGCAPAATLRSELAQRWGMVRRPSFAGGAGDNPAGAVGIGAIRAGTAFISLGTSGALLVPTSRIAANPDRGVHTFCHAIPGMWIQAGAILSAASCLAWISRLFGIAEAELLAPLGSRPQVPSPVSFLPYLAGERTPHDDPVVRGMLDGLSHGTDREAIVQAVLEGVAFALADCRDVLADAGITVAEADAIGGGSRSRFWLSVLASVLNVPIHRFAEGETGAAFGAARLGRLAVTGEAIDAVCTPPRRIETFEPDRVLVDAYADRLPAWRELYRPRR